MWLKGCGDWCHIEITVLDDFFCNKTAETVHFVSTTYNWNQMTEFYLKIPLKLVRFKTLFFSVFQKNTDVK